MFRNLKLTAKILLAILAIMIVTLMSAVVYVAPALRGLADEIYSADFSHEQAIAAADSVIFILVMLNIGGIIVLIPVLFFTLRYFLRPLKKLVAQAEEVANGNTDVDFTVEQNDEVGMVSGAFLKIVESLRMLESDLTMTEKMLYSGRTHYRIENRDLKGVFGKTEEKVNAVINDFEYTIDLLTEPYLCIDTKIRRYG